MSEVENKVEGVVDGAPVEAPADAPAIGLVDLQNAVKVIDHAADQGAFKGWQTIEQVMAVRNKLVAFIVYASPKEEPKADKKTKAAKPAAKKVTPAAKKTTAKKK